MGDRFCERLARELVSMVRGGRPSEPRRPGLKSAGAEAEWRGAGGTRRAVQSERLRSVGIPRVDPACGEDDPIEGSERP